MPKTTIICNPPLTLMDVFDGNYLNMLTRDELRNIAKHFNVPRGKNKSDTLTNLSNSDAPVEVLLELRPYGPTKA